MQIISKVGLKFFTDDEKLIEHTEFVSKLINEMFGHLEIPMLTETISNGFILFAKDLETFDLVIDLVNGFWKPEIEDGKFIDWNMEIVNRPENIENNLIIQSTLNFLQFLFSSSAEIKKTNSENNYIVKFPMIHFAHNYLAESLKQIAQGKIKK
jgi:hypothetical protein